MLPGDVVIRLDGVEINGVDDLIRALDRDRIDRRLAMDVLRMGRLRAIDIHPVERKPAAGSMQTLVVRRRVAPSRTMRPHRACDLRDAAPRSSG